MYFLSFLYPANYIKMKTKLILNKLGKSLHVLLFAAIFISVSHAQEKSNAEFKDFKITIENTEKGLNLVSTKGSAWNELHFEVLPYKPLTIDAYDETEPNKRKKKKKAELADYIFTIIKTKDGISLTGLKGTAWETLSFSLVENGKQTINQYGMTD